MELTVGCHTAAGNPSPYTCGNSAAGLVTHTTAFQELALRELRAVRVPAPRGSSIAAGVASLRPAHGCRFTIG